MWAGDTRRSHTPSLWSFTRNAPPSAGPRGRRVSLQISEQRVAKPCLALRAPACWPLSAHVQRRLRPGHRNDGVTVTPRPTQEASGAGQAPRTDLTPNTPFQPCRPPGRPPRLRTQNARLCLLGSTAVSPTPSLSLSSLTPSQLRSLNSSPPVPGLSRGQRTPRRSLTGTVWADVHVGVNSRRC